jgi:hypothetical protein
MDGIVIKRLEAKRYFLGVNDVGNLSLTLAYQF